MGRWVFIQATTAFLVLLLQGCHTASMKDWEGRVPYWIYTDRFARNNGSEAKCANWYTYCGGGWEGIVEKLDYIASIGVDALIISPVTANMPNG
jgi:alpha-amylase